MPAILDLRDAKSFSLAHSAGAVNIPWDELPSRMYELPEKSAELSVYHADPATLAQAIALLADRGYRARPIALTEPLESGVSAGRLWRPAPLLIEALGYATVPGRAADLGCGSGREAVYLSLNGWQVEALDILPDALANAQALASRNHVSVVTREADLREPGSLQSQSYDLILMFRFWRAQLLAEAKTALRPGGLLVVEAFAPADQHRQRNCVTAEELSRQAADMDIKLSREQTRNGRHFAQLIALRR